MGDDRFRLFCALQLPDDALATLVAWQAEHLRDGRVVRREDLHVTLAFLGSRPAEELPVIAGALREASADSRPLELRPVGYRETRSVGMLVCDDPGGGAAMLADDLQARLERLGVYRREARPWLPHVTVLRFKQRAGLALQPPNTCSIHVVRSALYRSTLGAGGARYDALETAALGGR
ncbi:MAG TPA: RNA 2',3'-cyclic phosphodiesterase [Gaiellaceae bacterium]|nr:RNA 2',3'-cyclic phosphodiesterase [Gaiellaceae bacterium]